MKVSLCVFLVLTSLTYISCDGSSKYNYQYVYSASPEDKNTKTGSFHVSMTSDGKNNEWKTVINDEGDVDILEKIPILNNILQTNGEENKIKILRNNIRRRNPSNYRKSPVIYEWVSPSSDSQPSEEIFKNFPVPKEIFNDKVIPPRSPIPLYQRNNIIERPIDRTPENFLHPQEMVNSNFLQKMDFAIPWFGARYYEKHQPIPESVAPVDYVRNHAMNTYGNGRELFNEMQGKLNNLFKDFNF
uniref:Uncharacterized protein n=1 Tax=Parastrongyloides trichosuri TaxID=131310 RepID=A0A0N5A2Z1_PARTI